MALQGNTQLNTHGPRRLVTTDFHMLAVARLLSHIITLATPALLSASCTNSWCQSMSSSTWTSSICKQSLFHLSGDCEKTVLDICICLGWGFIEVNVILLGESSTFFISDSLEYTGRRNFVMEVDSVIWYKEHSCDNVDRLPEIQPCRICYQSIFCSHWHLHAAEKQTKG
jgi:hypothetical protein